MRAKVVQTSVALMSYEVYKDYQGKNQDGTTQRFTFNMSKWCEKFDMVYMSKK